MAEQDDDRLFLLPRTSRLPTCTYSSSSTPTSPTPSSSSSPLPACSLHPPESRVSRCFTASSSLSPDGQWMATASPQTGLAVAPVYGPDEALWVKAGDGWQQPVWGGDGAWLAVVDKAALRLHVLDGRSGEPLADSEALSAAVSAGATAPAVSWVAPEDFALHAGTRGGVIVLHKRAAFFSAAGEVVRFVEIPRVVPLSAVPGAGGVVHGATFMGADGHDVELQVQGAGDGSDLVPTFSPGGSVVAFSPRRPEVEAFALPSGERLWSAAVRAAPLSLLLGDGVHRNRFHYTFDEGRDVAHLVGVRVHGDGQCEELFHNRVEGAFLLRLRQARVQPKSALGFFVTFGKDATLRLWDSEEGHLLMQICSVSYPAPAKVVARRFRVAAHGVVSDNGRTLVARKTTAQDDAWSRVFRLVPRGDAMAALLVGSRSAGRGSAAMRSFFGSDTFDRNLVREIVRLLPAVSPA